MLFLDLIFKNLFRNKKKFFLSLFGLSLIFLILLFPLVLLESSSDLSNGKVTISGDFIIEPKLNLDNLSSDLGVKSSANVPFYYDTDYLNNHFSLFNNVSGVNELFYIVSGEYTELGSDNYFINSTDLNKLNLSIIEGNVFSNSSQVIIAKNLARDSDKNVGDNLLIKGKNYTVSGIFEGNSYFSYSIISSLDVWKSSLNISLNESNMEDLSLSNQSNSLVSGENQGEFGKLIFIGNFTADANKDQIRNNINSIDSNWICVDSLDNSQDVQVTNQLNSSLYLLIECIVLIINGIILIYSFVSSIDDKIKDLAIKSCWLE